MLAGARTKLQFRLKHRILWDFEASTCDQYQLQAHFFALFIHDILCTVPALIQHIDA